MPTQPVPAVAPATQASAPTPAEGTAASADFLSVLLGSGALQWPPAVTRSTSASPGSSPAVAADAQTEEEPATPDDAIAALAMLLAPLRDPAAADTRPAQPAASGAKLPEARATPDVLPLPSPPKPAASEPVLETLRTESRSPEAAREPALRLATLDGLELRAPEHRSTAERSGEATTTVSAAAGTTDFVARTGGHPAAMPLPETAKVPVGHPRWAEAVGHEVSLLIDRGLQSATLRLSPEQLGPLEVRIEVSDDRAQVWFGATHADTRVALADAMPRLREMLASAGLQLVDSGVHRDAPRDPPPTPQARSGQVGAVGDEGDLALTLDRRALGLVDEYA